MPCSRLIAAGIVMVLVAPGAGAAQDSTKQLLARTGEYLDDFVRRFSNVVAEERYLQKAPNRKRELISDFLLVVYPGATEWHPFRDVGSVDGKDVAAEERGRLTRLFVEPSANRASREKELSEASRRYNLPAFGPFSNPLQVLAYLQLRYQPRFRFTIGPLDRDVEPGVRLLRFDEIARPTLVQRGSNIDLPVYGRAWIVENSGAVVKTELHVGSLRSETEIVTTFAFDAQLDVYVPVEMRETYPERFGELSTGLARYGRFRRFQVNADATISAPPR
jgi:hypothetical protein